MFPEKRKFKNLKGFVNGVLRNVARNIEKIEYPKEQKERLSVIYSVPKWIIEKWTKEYGISKTEEMLEGLYKPKATSVRCNTSKATVEEIVISPILYSVKSLASTVPVPLRSSET